MNPYKDWDEYKRKTRGRGEFQTEDEFNEWANRKSRCGDDFITPLTWKKIPNGGWESVICYWRRKKK